MTIMLEPKATNFEQQNLKRTANFPRIRYMGSKYKVVPFLSSIVADIQFENVLDAFSGSGVVSYSFKELGKQVFTNDFLNFSSTIAKAVVENPGILLNQEDVEYLLSPNQDGRQFIQNTFQGLYFPLDDHVFLDSVWSHLDQMPVYKRELAISALCLAAARKQPRGVFTITDLRYDDGRKNLHTPLKELFIESVVEYNQAVFDNGKKNRTFCMDIFEFDPYGIDLVYFDPPYAPPKDDADYIKRYHFLEGLSQYWQGLTIMENTKTKKIPKRYTPFAYKRTICNALRELFSKFRQSTIILSYSSNSIPNEKELFELLKEVKQDVEVFSVPHTYSFGTHETAKRRQVEEFIFVAR